MKVVCLIRHAKSESRQIGFSDFDRSLSNRGRLAASDMAAWLKKKMETIDLFVSSPANRAVQTCKLFAEQFQTKTNEIRFQQDLYEGDIPQYKQCILSLPNEKNSVAIFGHNPGITDFSNTLVEGIVIDNIPTSGIFSVQSNCGSWTDFFSSDISLMFFHTPKLL